MFVNNIQMTRALRALARRVLPSLLVLLVLSVVTELRTRQIPLTDILEFWPAITVNILPGLMAIFSAYVLAAGFVRSLYGLGKLGEGFRFLWRWRFGVVGEPEDPPVLRIAEGMITGGRNVVMTRLGGPGNLVVHNDAAVVLERAGYVSRVERSGFGKLEAFEKVYKVVDTRPKRKMRKVRAMTRECVSVESDVDIIYQIRRGGQKPTPRYPFPVMANEVVKAGTCTWKCEMSEFMKDLDANGDGELDWEELVIFCADGILRSILARYSMDQLTGQEGGQEAELQSRQEIREELGQELSLAVREFGAEIVSVDIGDIRPRRKAAGVPDSFIEHIASLAGTPIQFYSCFICYSSKDKDIADRLHADLQSKGIRCWFAPEDMKIGDRIRQRIDEAIRLYDKLLLILSEHSIDSDWVEKEVETAFEEERRRKRTVLFPIRLDDLVMETDQAWAAVIRQTRHIGDFRRWKDHDAYQEALARLVRDLEREEI